LPDLFGRLFAVRVLVESVCAGKEKTSQTLHTTGPMLASRCGTRARATPPGPRSLMLFAQDDVPGSRPTGAIHRSSPVRHPTLLSFPQNVGMQCHPKLVARSTIGQRHGSKRTRYPSMDWLIFTVRYYKKTIWIAYRNSIVMHTAAATSHGGLFWFWC
jgi:hypothetical protein